MPCRIRVLQRIPPHVHVPVVIKQVRGIRRQRIGTHKLPGDRVIVAGVHVDQAAGILLLPGEAVVRGHGGGGQAVLAVGVVALVPARR